MDEERHYIMYKHTVCLKLLIFMSHNWVNITQESISTVVRWLLNLLNRNIFIGYSFTTIIVIIVSVYLQTYHPTTSADQVHHSRRSEYGHGRSCRQSQRPTEVKICVLYPILYVLGPHAANIPFHTFKKIYVYYFRTVGT